ncbi:Golgi-associated plant pathogenesis-related protein 1, partial [Folsomia candida]
LGQNAAKWAKRVHDKVILLGRVVALYSHPHIEGENVFVSSGGGGVESGGIDGKAAIQRWYKEMEKYDFDANTFSLKIAQFTQLDKLVLIILIQSRIMSASFHHHGEEGCPTDGTILFNKVKTTNNHVDVLNSIANLLYRKTTSFTSGEYNIASFISAVNEKNFGGIKFSIHSWENNRTWISFIDPTKEYTFSLSQNLCKTLGYTRCIFPGSGNYPSEMSQIDVGRPPHNELWTLFFHKWTTKKIVTTVNSTLEKSIECLSNQTDGAVKVLLSCDGTKFAIHKSNSSLYLQFTEDFNLQFGLDPVLIGSTLTILDKNSTSAHPFTLKDEWNKCSKNLTIVSLTSSSETFMKGDAISLLGLIQSINRRFIKSPFFMNITISSSKNQPTSIITFLDQFDKYIITFSEELSQVLGINQTQFHASGEYTGSTSADDEIFNGLDPDQEFIITLTQKAIQRIHIPPPQYMSYPSTVKTINNALQSFGSHKIALTISQDFENLEINIFTNLSVTFSPCLNKLFHMKPFDSFTSSSTSIQLPPILLPKDINTTPQIIPSTSQNAEEEEESGTAMDTSPDDAVDDNTSMQVEDDARKVPTSQDQRKCYTIINEILPTKRWLNTLSKKQFIEIVHRCDKRAGISQREDIVIWRGKYLRELRRNEAAEKPFKIVYIDETWVDGNMHVARGWFPKTCKSIKEMAPFTYGTTSMATGPRLIVLSALTEDEEDEDSGDEDSDQEDCIARATTVVMENGDQVDHGGDLSLWDCDWAYDIFERELEIGNYMVDTTATRGRGRGFKINDQTKKQKSAKKLANTQISIQALQINDLPNKSRSDTFVVQIFSQSLPSELGNMGKGEKLGQNAAKWAKRVHDKVILLGRVVALYSHPHIEGENVFVSSGGGGGESGGGGGESGGIDGKAAVQRWYKEIEKYDFDANMFSLKTAQFTQLVWKRTRRLGIGGIYDPGRNFTVIVARFKPPGNIGFGSSFRENIFPPAKDPPPIMNQVESFPGSINGHNFGTNLSHQNKSEGTPTRAKAPALPHLTSNNKDAHNFGTISHSTSANKVTTTEKSVGIQAPQNPATTAPSPPTMKLIITEKIGPSLKILTKNVHHVTPKSIIPVTTTTTKPVTKKSVTTSLPHNYNNATGPVRMEYLF